MSEQEAGDYYWMFVFVPLLMIFLALVITYWQIRKI